MARAQMLHLLGCARTCRGSTADGRVLASPCFNGTTLLRALLRAVETRGLLTIVVGRSHVVRSRNQLNDIVVVFERRR